jgi:hypothetical protein
LLRSVGSQPRTGDFRWKQQFDVSEGLREFAHLREVLVYHLVEFQSANPEISGALWLLEMIVLHRYLDHTMRTSVSNTSQPTLTPNNEGCRLTNRCSLGDPDCLGVHEFADAGRAELAPESRAFHTSKW